MFALYQVHEGIRGFVAAGGPVLYGLGLLSFAMWTLVFERAWYFRFGLRRDAEHVVAAWEGRAERQSWHARQIRRAMLSRLRFAQLLEEAKSGESIAMKVSAWSMPWRISAIHSAEGGLPSQSTQALLP